MLRRLTVFALLLALTLGLAGPAGAQAVQPNQYTTPGPGGIIAYSTASITSANTTGEYTMWSYTIPQGFMGTSSATNQTPPVRSSLPLHLVMLGNISTAGPASGNGSGIPLSIGVNFGGTTATMSLVNNIPITNGMAARPMRLDVWLAPIATTGTTNTVYMTGKLSFYPAANGAIVPTVGATETAFNATVIGTTSIQTAQTLAVNWRWGTASTTNAGTFYQRSLSIGP